MQPFETNVKPEIGRDSPNSLPVACSHPVDIFEAGLEARIAQALAVRDYRQAALATLAHPAAAARFSSFAYETILNIAHGTAPIMSLEATAVELAASAVLQGRAAS